MRRARGRTILNRAAASAVALVLTLAWAVPRSGLGQGEAAKAKEKAKDAAFTPPSGIDLLNSPAFDRITLSDNAIYFIEPISPRPLPPYDPEKDERPAPTREPAGDSRPKGRGNRRPAPPAEGNVGLPTKAAQPKGAAAEKGREKDEGEPPANELVVHLLDGGDTRDYKVRRASIKRVDYFEDVLLAEGERLVRDRDYARAFEFYLVVQARNPKWPGLAEHIDKLLFDEGTWAIAEKDRDRGLRLLRELHDRRPDYPELAAKLAEVYAGTIDEALAKGQYRYGRRELRQLEAVAPAAIVTKQARDRFVGRARKLAEEAARKEGGDRLDALTEALRVWPDLAEAEPRYREAFAALPTLDVAVIDVPRPVTPRVRTPAAARVARLLYLPILADESEDAMLGKRPGQLAAGVTSAELGRRLEITLRDGPAWSDGSRGVSALDVVRALSDRAEPHSPAFKARWADLLGRVEATDERQVTVYLTRSIPRPEAWLLDPVGPAHAAWDGRVPTPDGRRRSVGDGPFAVDSADDARATYRAARPAAPADSGGGLPIRRLRESRHATGADALGALARGEVSLVELIPPDRVAALSGQGEIKVGRYTEPSLHRIALDARNPALRSRALRRGLAYAIDRKTLLEETALRRPIDEFNAPSDGPFAKGSTADAPDVRPYAYDPVIARALVAGARKELGGDPIRLKFEYPARPDVLPVIPKLVEALKAAGLEIEPVERPESELEEALRSGRKFDLAYRAGRVVDPIAEAGPLLCPGYDAPPSADALASLASPRMLQLLLELEQAQEPNAARALALQVDREARDELPVIPLWQLQDHYAWRARLTGPGESADSLYRGIEQWRIEPWTPKDPR